MSGLRTHVACAYACIGFLLLYGIGWVGLAGFLPPPSPTESAEDLAEKFADDSLQIRIGMALSIMAAAFLLPWGGAVNSQIRRIEGRHAPLAWAWAAAQGCIVIEFAYPCAIWAVAAYRAEDPARVQLFNDFAWLCFLGIVSTALFQMVVLAVVVFRDPRPEPLFPRWFGYFQVWCFVGVSPAGFIYVFKAGPMAWDGIIACWIAITFAGVWLIGTTIMVVRAARVPVSTDDLDPHDRELTDRVARLEAALGTQSLSQDQHVV